MLAGGIAPQANGAVAVLPLGIAGFLFGGCSAAVFIQFTAPTLICYLNGECRGEAWDLSGTIDANGSNAAEGVVGWDADALGDAADGFPPIPAPPVPVPGAGSQAGTTAGTDVGVGEGVSTATGGSGGGCAFTGVCPMIVWGNDRYGMQHILKRHGASSSETGGKFFTDNPAEISLLIAEASLRGFRQWVAQGNKCVINVDLGRHIGLVGLGGPRASALRVVIDNVPSAKVMTAYPIGGAPQR